MMRAAENSRERAITFIIFGIGFITENKRKMSELSFPRTVGVFFSRILLLSGSNIAAQSTAITERFAMWFPRELVQCSYLHY